MSVTQRTASSSSFKSSLKIYISYSHRDMKAVEELHERLRLEGFINLFWDHDLSPGDSWILVLENNLRKSDVILFCISKYSIQSQSVENELNIAVASSEKIVLIPIRLEECSVPPFLADRHWVNLFDSTTSFSKEEGYRALIKALRYYSDDRGKNTRSGDGTTQPIAGSGGSTYTANRTKGESVISPSTAEILPGMKLGLDPNDPINRSAINDKAIERKEDDKLKFVPYVTALYEFIK